MKGVYAPHTEDTSAGPSFNIWGDCPWEDAQSDPSVGYWLWEDFIRFGVTPTITTLIAGLNGHTLFGSAGATILPDDARGGGLVLTEATDDEAVGITLEQHPFWISQGYGQLWFEARIKTSTITTAKQGWVCGLMDTTSMTAAVPVTADGAIADINFVGFHHPEANTTAFDASYKADGVTAVEVNSDIGVLAVDTYIKLGMRFVPPDKNQLAYYVNGVEQATKKIIPDATGTDFPADIGLAPVLAQTLAASTSASLTIDWWRMFQMR